MLCDNLWHFYVLLISQQSFKHNRGTHNDQYPFNLPDKEQCKCYFATFFIFHRQRSLLYIIVEQDANLIIQSHSFYKLIVSNHPELKFVWLNFSRLIPVTSKYTISISRCIHSSHVNFLIFGNNWLIGGLKLAALLI